MIRRLTHALTDFTLATRWQVEGLVTRTRDLAGYTKGSDNTKAPVMIVPGIYEPWTFMRPIVEALHASGHSVHVLDVLGYNTGQIPLAAAAVEDYIRSRDLRGVVIVAHSKGGLIGKYLLAHHNTEARVARLIAVASPFSGSFYARFSFIGALRDLSPSAEIIRHLKRRTEVNPMITSIYPAFDQQIPRGSALEGAYSNLEVPVVGHFRVLSHPVALRLITEHAARSE